MLENEKFKGKRNVGLNKYGDTILDICNIENTYDISPEERDGFFGIAMVMAFRDGASPNVQDMSEYLDVNSFLLENAFNNLRINGVFGASFNVRNNPIFKVRNDEIFKNHTALLTWCHIAGLSSGFCGLN